MKHIKSNLDEYLEFDSDQLFQSLGNLVRIFGGAIRDSICGDPIKDVDILCGSKSMSYMKYVLERNGYHFLESLNGKDLQEMYSDIHVINEPHTWVKGKKIIQLIRPAKSGNDYINSFNDLISNVDLSCCGVSWDLNGLHEDYKGAVVHCQNKVFTVNKFARMYSTKRIIHRKQKLSDRGWREVPINQNLDRDLKLNILDIV